MGYSDTEKQLARASSPLKVNDGVLRVWEPILLLWTVLSAASEIELQSCSHATVQQQQINKAYEIVCLFACVCVCVRACVLFLHLPLYTVLAFSANKSDTDNTV